MGISTLGRSCAAVEYIGIPNPDPSNYIILYGVQIGIYAILKIKYYGCINFEGNKICVFKDSIERLKSMASIDPHFFDKSSLIARFKPTEEGFAMAVNLCNLLMRDENKKW